MKISEMVENRHQKLQKAALEKVIKNDIGMSGTFYHSEIMEV